MSTRSVFTLIVVVFLSLTAQAAQRTFVSAGSGSDGNPCTRQAPCRNFAAAMAQTDSGGEVVVLDSGGYGAVSINQPVSLISPAGVYAGITAFGGDAITVDVDNAVVVLRGLSLNALGGVVGINFIGPTMSASNTDLFVENCVITGFGAFGLNFARNGTLLVSDLIARENFIGIFVDGSPSLPSTAIIVHALMERNMDGLRVENATVAIRDSMAVANANVGFHAFASMSGMTADLSADHCQATGNIIGFLAGSPGGGPVPGTPLLMVSNSFASSNLADGIIANPNSTVRTSNNTVTGNGTGFRQFGTGVFRSRGNNTVDGNTTETSGTITTFGPM